MIPFLPLSLILCVLDFAAPARAQEYPSAPAPVTTADEKIALEDVAFLLLPLTQEELAKD